MARINKSADIAEKLAERIRTGEIEGKLPSEKELSEEFSVARMTAARVLNLLRESGLVQRISSKGTFVVPREVRKLRVFTNYFLNEEYFRLLEEQVSGVELVPVYELDKADLAIFTTTLPLNCTVHFLPLPEEMVRRLRDGERLYPQVFEFHRIGSQIYGIPYDFCPNLLIYNKELMRRLYPDFEPYRFTMEDLIAVAAEHPDQFMKDAASANILLFVLAYAYGSLEKAVPLFRHFKFSASDSERDFEKGDFLFASILRSFLPGMIEQGKFDIMPIPLIRGRRFCHAASESFFVTRNCRHLKEAFQIVEASLSPRFQQKIASEKGQIAADRIYAAASMDSRFHRDDFFFQEIPHIHYPREIIAPMSTAVVLSGLKQLVGGRMQSEDFLELLNEEKKAVERQNRAVKFLLASTAGGRMMQI